MRLNLNKAEIKHRGSVEREVHVPYTPEENRKYTPIYNNTQNLHFIVIFSRWDSRRNSRRNSLSARGSTIRTFRSVLRGEDPSAQIRSLEQSMYVFLCSSSQKELESSGSIFTGRDEQRIIKLKRMRDAEAYSKILQ